MPGLKRVPPDQRPPVPSVFYAFRVMVGIGLLMILFAFLGVFYWWRGTLFEQRWYLRVVAQCWWFGFVAVIAGWVVTETGRQPWVVYGQMLTADAASPVGGNTVLGTLILFVVAYAIVFWFGIYYINRLIARGPDPGTTGESEYFSNNPLSGAHDRATGEQANRGREESRCRAAPRPPWNGICR